ncbi:MAG: hypothetical protein GEEBNDBF_00576 [bacterium]|nr:hypothetical protein [bacterium]
MRPGKDRSILTSQYSRRSILAAGVGGALALASRPHMAFGTDVAVPVVLPGLDVLALQHRERLTGKRIGLVCNHTATTATGVHAIDLLRSFPETTLVSLFAPEHGLKGRVIAGNIADSVDEATGLPVWSLHGTHRKPTPAMLKGLDLVLIDLQDVGARFYTYSSTLALVMQAAGAQGLPVLVLDRPNPIGGDALHGPLLDPASASFLGYYPVPVRHGLTVGEFARLVQGAYGVACELDVIPMHGWRRGFYWAETGLPWQPPSPSLWRPEATITYPGICFFEGTNCSVGGSTFYPYEVVAAPWIDGAGLAATLNGQGWAGVRYEAISYTPEKPNDGKYQGEVCQGVWLQLTDRQRFDPVVAACAVLRQVHRDYSDKLTFRKPHMRLLGGSDTFLETLLNAPGLRGLAAIWEAECAAFDQLRSPYLLYST